MHHQTLHLAKHGFHLTCGVIYPATPATHLYNSMSDTLATCTLRPTQVPLIVCRASAY
jgi:hypothetical protein